VETVKLHPTGITTKIASVLTPKEARGKCPNCDVPLELRKFVDSYGPNDEPGDINKDLYCPKCDIRWQQEPGPHDFWVEKRVGGR